MAIGFLSMTTPLLDRIDMWAKSGKATKILLHPEDWDLLTDNKREQLEAQYNLPVVCLGGERAYLSWKHRTKSDEQQEEIPFEGETS